MKYSLNSYSLTHFLSHYRIVPAKKRPKFIILPSGPTSHYVVPFTLPEHLPSSETSQSVVLCVKSRSTNPTLCGCSTAQSRANSSSQSSTRCLAAAAADAGLGSGERASTERAGENRPGQPKQNFSQRGKISKHCPLKLTPTPVT